MPRTILRVNRTRKKQEQDEIYEEDMIAATLGSIASFFIAKHKESGKPVKLVRRNSEFEYISAESQIRAVQ